MEMTSLYHHGIKGQKWGVRRYQYADGTLTPDGKKRYSVLRNGTKVDKFSYLMGTKVKDLVNTARTQITGNQYVDGCLKNNTEFARIQTSKVFEKFPFYATYKKADQEKYLGLFGKQLINRAKSDAKKAEKTAAKTGNESDTLVAKEARDRADNMKVYQLRLNSTKKLKVPSDKNAGDITADLLKEDEFKKNVIASIEDSKEKMRRPQQQILFNQAQKALSKDVNRLSSTDKVAIYKALNLSLVYHNAQEIAAQNRFYSELKKKGYNALLDYNDKEYSSYHAKRPMIVFDTDSVKLKSVTQINPNVVNTLYKKCNTERILKEIPASTIGTVAKYGSMKVSDCQSYMDNKMRDYLES